MFRKQKHLVHYVSMGTFLALKPFYVWNARKNKNKIKLNNKSIDIGFINSYAAY